MRLNKKGGAGDLFIFMIVGFILVISCVLWVYIGNTAYQKIMEHNETLQEAIGPGANVVEVIDGTIGVIPTAYSSLKWITFMIIAGMILSIIITSFLIQTKPVFFVAYIFVWIVAIIVSVPLSNSYEIIYANPTLASSFTGFWGATYIFLNLPIWITVVGCLAGIIMFINMVKISRSIGF